MGTEDKLQQLEKEIAELRQTLTSVQDREAIGNLMARHQFLLAAQQGSRIVEELWTQDAEKASLEYGASGVYEGLWKVRSFYVSRFLPGTLLVKALSTQQLVVEGETARGSWMAVGMDLDAGELGPAAPRTDEQRQFLLSSRTKDGKQYRAEWQWQRIDVNFRREEGSWKIHNLHVREYFRSPYDVSPVEYAKTRFETDGMWLESLFETPEPFPVSAHGENLPSGSTTSHWQYTTDCDARQLEDPAE